MRDFFYNKGDVLITVLIVLVAATVIYFRVGVIMGDADPGERLKGWVSPLFSSGQAAEEPEYAAEEPQVQYEPPAPADTQPEQTPAAQEPPVTEDPVVEEPPTEAPAATAADAKITINAGDTASAIADKLLAAGAIPDKQAFLDEVSAKDAASRLKQGSFTIPAGSSIGDIIGILTG